MKVDQQEKVRHFLEQQRFAVLSTVTPEYASESAVVEFSKGEGFQLVFDTLPAFRKYKNLKNNPLVSVVIGSEPMSVQYEGVAVELMGEEREKARTVHFGRFPEAKKFEEQGLVFFKIVPKWLRYTDVSRQPWERLEIAFPFQE